MGCACQGFRQRAGTTEQDILLHTNPACSYPARRPGRKKLHHTCGVMKKEEHTPVASLSRNTLPLCFLQGQLIPCRVHTHCSSKEEQAAYDIPQRRLLSTSPPLSSNLSQLEPAGVPGVLHTQRHALESDSWVHLTPFCPVNSSSRH